LNGQAKKFESVALIINWFRHDFEVDTIRRLANLINLLITLKCEQITLYDKDGILRQYSAVIKENLKREMTHNGAHTIVEK